MPNPNGNPNWVKGVSANPSGRPHGLKIHIVRNKAREYSVEAIEYLVTVMRGETEHTSNRLIAAQALLDRGWGKPTQPVSGDDEMPGLQVDVYAALIDSANRVAERRRLTDSRSEFDPIVIVPADMQSAGGRAGRDLQEFAPGRSSESSVRLAESCEAESASATGDD